jgi:hypothetical protein
VLIEPHTFSTAVAGRGTCSRMQLPIKLAWSITVRPRVPRVEVESKIHRVDP